MAQRVCEGQYTFETSRQNLYGFSVNFSYRMNQHKYKYFNGKRCVGNRNNMKNIKEALSFHILHAGKWILHLLEMFNWTTV